MADDIKATLAPAPLVMFGATASWGFWYVLLALVLFVIFYLDMVRDGN